MTPQDTIRAVNEAGETWFAIFLQERGAEFILFVLLVFVCTYLMWRLYRKERQTESVHGSLGVSYKMLYDQQAELIKRVEQAERNAVDREQECQRNLERTREEMEGQRLMVVRLRQKLFSKNVLSDQDQRELDAAYQHTVSG